MDTVKKGVIVNNLKKNIVMKNILLASIVLLFMNSNAQEKEGSINFFDPAGKVVFTNSILLKDTSKIKTTLDIYSLGYQYRLPKIEHQIYPNPVNMGDYVTISPVKLGEVISIFEPTGIFVKSQAIDIDKRIDTLDLKKGEYLVSTRTAVLKLVVE